MREINPEYVSQKKGEPHRRWFENEYFDLLVWENETGEIVGFQLSYDKKRDQHALTWEKQKGYIHDKVDDGESSPGRLKASAILLPDGIFRNGKIAERFKRNIFRHDGCCENDYRRTPVWVNYQIRCTAYG